MTTSSRDSHPFGSLLGAYLKRKPGLTKKRLAELAGFDQAIVVRMAKGGKDLTGPSGRERVLRLIETLHEIGVLASVDEANDFLRSAAMPPLFEGQKSEARLLMLLQPREAHAQDHPGLPQVTTTFIGRERELADVCAALAGARLLTLVGAGGSGKTRIAQQALRRVHRAYADGACYIELAKISEPGAVPDAMLSALGIISHEDAGRERLLRYFSDRHTLLVLDNCEHLIADVAQLAADLLRGCPKLTILATSRERLDIADECVWAVPTLTSADAAALFAERARAVPGVAEIEARDPHVRHICDRLDGIPLAIELATARLSTLSLAELAARIDNRFALLTNGRRNALQRHQTLRALVDWSVNLLSESERELFRRLAVFTGGWTLALAEHVVAGDGLAVEDVPALLSNLVAKSLVNLERHEDVSHYRFLETLREYARSLPEPDHSPSSATLARRHCSGVLKTAEDYQRRMRIAVTPALRSEIERMYPNIRAALEWSIDRSNDGEAGCLIVGVLHEFWLSCTHGDDYLRWAPVVRRLADGFGSPKVKANVLALFNHWLDPTPVWEMPQQYDEAHALYVEAGDAIGAADMRGRAAMLRLFFFGESEQPAMVDELDRAMEDARRLGAGEVARHFLLRKAGIKQMANDFEAADLLFLEAAAASRAANALDQLAENQHWFGNSYMRRGDCGRALELLFDAREQALLARNPRLELMCDKFIGQLYQLTGRWREAIEVCERSLRMMHDRMPDSPGEELKHIIALAQIDGGEYQRAAVTLLEFYDLVDRWAGRGAAYWWVHDTVACLAVATGRYAAAALLFGAAHGDYSQSYNNRWAYDKLSSEPFIERAKAGLGDQEYARQFEQGAALSVADAVAYARRFCTELAAIARAC